MDESRNNELLRIISEILEYTENATPTTKPPCACGDCGLYYFDDPQMICVKEDCSGKDCETRTCYNCFTGTPPCKDFCACDTGSDCATCRSDEECTGQKTKKCPKDCPDLQCGTCEPKKTPTPTTTKTQPCKCLLDCGAQFSSYESCDKWITSGGCPDYLKCWCKNVSCTCPNGEKNPNCYDVNIGPTPTPPPTPTSTCPKDCKDKRCAGDLYEIGQCTWNCVKSKEDFCVKCESRTCTGGGFCPIVRCEECVHEPKECGNGNGYRTLEDCKIAIRNKPRYTCDPCDKFHPKCGQNGALEKCYCPNPPVTWTFTVTFCNCDYAAGPGWVERCSGEVADAGNFECPGDEGRTIHCELCATPTPSACLCSDITGNCFQDPSSCESWADEQESNDPNKTCTCAAPTNKSCPKNPSRYVTCSCGTCTKNTPSPTPTPTISCAPVNGCCPDCSSAEKSVRCNDRECCYLSGCKSVKKNNPDKRCPPSDCYVVSYRGCYARLKLCGMNGIGPNGEPYCIDLGAQCTLSNTLTCDGQYFLVVEDTQTLDFGIC
jgi:hypothetical protein